VIAHTEVSREQLQSLIQRGDIAFAGNRKLKIYGMLTCGSGTRMKKENRVFFKDAWEARGLGYRPCGRCMKAAFERWRKG
jgi:methylphosphotriester-DNA--protein-cysteine methyltransferase